MTALNVRLLGGFEVAGACGPPLPAGKPEAFLAYLAVPAGRSHRRDKLASLLWGSRVDAKARHSLAQTLYLVRKTLSADDNDVLIVSGANIALDASRINVDVNRFESLVAQRTADALTEAVALYRGDLLEGLDPREDAFEDWLRRERGRLREIAVDALKRLMRHQIDTDDETAAAETAHRLLALDPLQEPVHRALMRLHFRAGRREAAIHQYMTCLKTLNRELRIDPDAETKALYCAIAKERTASDSRPAVTGQFKDHSSSIHLPFNKPSIAVFPFANLSGDEEHEYIADGMTEDIITGLSRFRSLFVIARSSTFSYKNEAADVQEIARDLDVRYVLEGSVRKRGNRVRITTKLIDATRGSHLWADRFDGSLDDVFDLQDQITEQIVVAVEPEIHTHERERVKHKSPSNLDAWELVQRGLSHFYRVNNTDRADAIRLFRKAIALDPEFAAAHAHLAYALCASGILGYAQDTAGAVASVKAAAERAVSLDPNEPMGHYALGRAHIVAGEIETAIDEMQNAVAINPSFARGHYGLGFAYHFGAGQVEIALPYYDTALRLSPRDPTRWVTLMFKGSALRFLGRHKEASVHCRRACQFPNAGFQPHMHLAAALAAAGHRSEAQAAVTKARRLEPTLSIGFARSHFFGMHETILKSMLDGLRKAGVPE